MNFYGLLNTINESSGETIQRTLRWVTTRRVRGRDTGISMFFCRTCAPCLLLLLCLLIGPGCAAPHVIPDLKQDASFVHAGLVDGGIGVGGVVSAPEVFDQEACAKYAKLLGQRIHKERPALFVSPAEDVSVKIGAERYRSLLDKYREFGRLRAESIELLRGSSAARYLVFARVKSNTTREDRREYPQKEPEKDSLQKDYLQDNEKDFVFSSKKKMWVELSTTRHIVISLDVYDLVKGISAWSGSIHESATNSIAYGKKKDKRLVQGFLKSMSGVAVEMLFEPLVQPKAPGTDELMGKVFKEFAGSLP